jgi:acyl-CoA thioesterase
MARLLTDGNTPRQAGERQFELAGWIDTAPFEDLLGMRIEEAGEGRAVLAMDFPVKFAQGGGVLHGGALTALGDTAVAIAIKTLLPPGTVFATTELVTRFLAPVLAGPIRATATVIGPQGRTFTGAALLEAEGRPVANFTATFRVARGQGFEE